MKMRKSIELRMVLFLVAGLVQAQAHAFLEHADPRVGSIIGDSPKAIKMWFTEELEPSFTKAQVFNAQGAEVDKKDSHVDDTDAKMMTVSVPTLGPGTYKVIWHAVAVDTHHTMGTFTFEVKR
jgi:copper resistance protein C